MKLIRRTIARLAATVVSQTWIIRLAPRAAQFWVPKILPHNSDPAVFRVWVQLATSGLPEAQFQIARSYLQGTSVPQSYDEALKWFHRAATQGHSEAKVSVALLAIQGFVAPDGSASYRGKGGAIFSCRGSCKDRTPRFDVSLVWARLAAFDGVIEGQALLGYLLSFGPPSMRDLKVAREWLEKSAARGSPRGALALAMLLAGQDDGKSLATKVLALLTLASDKGLPLAARLLAISAEHGLGRERNPKDAFCHYQRAADGGDPFSQIKIGLALMMGIGTRADPTTGETWLRRSALSGDPEAAFLLGELYLHGIHVLPDYINAERWLEEAAQLGHRGASRTLGIIRLTGLFGVRDVKCALESLSKPL